MLITHEREKLINAIVYFVRNTNHCGHVKLFKLLNFLDFDHFKETGRSVTGLEYFAWTWGPVPKKLFFEIKGKIGGDMAEAVTFETRRPEENDSKKPTPIKLKKQFDSKYFSKRELRLLENLAFIFKDATADDMSKISHTEFMPWKKTIDAKGEKEHIVYQLVLDDKKLPRAKEIVEDLADEYKETIAFFS